MPDPSSAPSASPDPILNDITISVTGTISSSISVSLDTSGLIILDEPNPIPPEPTPPPTLPPEPTPPPTSEGALTVLIEYEDSTYDFRLANGIARHNYTDPLNTFTQRRIDVTNPALPFFTVQFRPDTTTSRIEIVFELGNTTPGTKAFNMTAYTATIRNGSRTLGPIKVPAHHWYSRWRYQSSPRPITTSIADLQRDGLLPYFDLTLATTRPLAPARTYTPMGLAGLTAYGPTTGERDEIGLFTEAQAEYIRGDTGPESLFAQAEASGTIPWHYRNEDGNAIFDFKDHPQATLYYPANIPSIATPVTPDVAHEPPLAYLPFLLTGDPYYLEELQFAATFNVLCSVPSQRTNFCIGFALRAHAWALRVLAQCARITPDDAPDWLQSRTYWQEWLDTEREWMLSRYVNPTETPFTEIPFADFHFMVNADGSPATTTLPASTYNSPWMEDYEGAVLGHVVQIGHTSFQPILEWKLANTVARTNGTSGWQRARTTPYTLALRETATSPYATSWSAIWDLNVQMQPPEFTDFSDPDTIPPDASLTYASYTLSSLALATSLRVEGAADCYTWLRSQIENNSTDSNYIDRKWSFSSK